jgi:hypothetical protein
VEGFIPLSVRKSVFVIFRGYIDESGIHNNTLFALSCLIATGKSWYEMERSWKLCLDSKNRQLKKVGRRVIRRYHASDCNSRHKDFEGWTCDEQIAFFRELLGTFKRTKGVHAVGYALNLDELCEVFPETTDRLDAAYYMLTKFVMQTIGDDFRDLGEGACAKVTLFHDRTANGQYDGTILRAFNDQIKDTHFPHAGFFTTISPLGWEDCVALQPADLVAFESCRYAAQKDHRRKSFEAMLDLPEFGVHIKMFTKEILQRMRRHLEEQQSAKTVS